MESTIKAFLIAILVSTVSGIGTAQSLTLRVDKGGSKSVGGAVAESTVDQTIDRIIAREHDEMTAFRAYHPVIETYVQDIKFHGAESVLWRDWYFLGQANLSRNLAVTSLISNKDRPAVRGPLIGEYLPEGFLEEAFIDRSGFDRQHYRFQFVGREFMGEVRCLVFDIEPLPGSREGRFHGRIWAEDEAFTIVRFSGAFYPISRVTYFPFPHPSDVMYAHFDSWRVNVQPDLWLPSYIFDQEDNITFGFKGRRGFKSQTRLWGYNIQSASRQGEFSAMSIESLRPLQDDSDTANRDPSPLQAKREWESEAERNALDTLERNGLLIASGEVDKTLDTVINNIEVGNHLDVEPDVYCRVLTTSNLEMFTIGHAIIVSRGLIDVLPNEATLATILAQGLADVMASTSSPDKYGFGDVYQVSAANVMKRFRFRESRSTQQIASEKALVLLRNSPYKDKLAIAGLFLKQMHQDAPALSQLINPNLGNSVYLASELINSSPSLEPHRLDQIAALPLGARVKLDPWNDEAQLLKGKTPQIVSPRDKMPFEITPFLPFLTRYTESGVAGTASGKMAIGSTNAIN